MSIIFAGYSPHPPVLIPDVGGDEVKRVEKTISALKSLFEDFPQVDALIIITPHGPIFQDAITVFKQEKLRGDFANFGAPQVELNCKNNLTLGEEIIKKAEQQGLLMASLNQDLAQSFNLSTELDHGQTVPLYYLKNEADHLPPIVPISIGLLSYEEMYLFGICIKEACESLKLKAGIIASGDLSHKLSKEAPAGYTPKAKEFDQQIISLFEAGEVLRLISIDKGLIEDAGECGFRPLLMLLGALDGNEIKADVLSYEAPFGVGYMVGKVEVGNKSKERKLYQKILALKKDKLAQVRNNESAPVRLARAALEHAVVTGGSLDNSIEDKEPPLNQKAGVFVSIKKDGQLRGCIGTVAPTKEDIASEIAANAVQAGMNDPRFEPVQVDELEALTYSVDILSAPEPIADEGELDPKNYGVIVSKGSKRGLLLPNLPGINSAQEQVLIAKQKAGIDPDETVRLERFLVTRYS